LLNWADSAADGGVASSKRSPTSTQPYLKAKHFFTEVAPYTNVKEFHGRFLAGVAKKVLHTKFRYHFSFKKNLRDVSVTLFYSDITDSIWVFIRPV